VLSEPPGSSQGCWHEQGWRWRRWCRQLPARASSKPGAASADLRDRVDGSERRNVPRRSTGQMVRTAV